MKEHGVLKVILVVLVLVVIFALVRMNRASKVRENIDNRQATPVEVDINREVNR